MATEVALGISSYAFPICTDDVFGEPRGCKANIVKATNGLPTRPMVNID
jgi:hypothetical protein